jgi:hypothetical protein
VAPHPDWLDWASAALETDNAAQTEAKLVLRCVMAFKLVFSGLQSRF